jgi:hypothetical protein
VFLISTQLCDAMGTDITNNELCKHFVSLLKDTEAEVRTAAATKVTGVCIKMPVENSVKLVLPCVKELVSDASQHARGKFFFRYILFIYLFFVFCVRNGTVILTPPPSLL